MDKSTRLVSNWIIVGIVMLLVQVLLGGITRLTGSGLSITEWKPIMGSIPPLNEVEWNKAFTQYQSIAQYKYLNNHFTLSNFKFIFFWEWFHRLWARLIAVAFLIPFIYFLLKKYIKPNMVKPLIILFLLGALQGAIGWIMVKSGLNDENLFVSHIKLSIHFVSAMVLIGYAVIVAMQLRLGTEAAIVNPKLKKITIGLIVLVTIQLFYGAFMAGLKAAAVAPTWPLLNGNLTPINWLGNGISDALFFNNMGVQFLHRTLAYIVFIAIVWWYIKAKQTQANSLFFKYKHLPLAIVLVQIGLGIASVLLSPKIVAGSFGVFEWMALAHQLVGMLLILSLVAMVYLVRFNSHR